MKLITRWLALTAVIGVLVACGSNPPPAAAAPGLITGRVLAGPLTPVSRPGQPGTRPVAGAMVEALRGTAKVAATHTDHDGYYQVTVPPGTYSITVSYPGYRPAPAVKTVVVAAGHRQTLDFTLDTGIR